MSKYKTLKNSDLTPNLLQALKETKNTFTKYFDENDDILKQVLYYLF